MGPASMATARLMGKCFDPNPHRCPPDAAFGTKVRVTNLWNGRSTVVRINDRGPFISHRVIDLAHGAANKLGLSPVASLRFALRCRRPFRFSEHSLNCTIGALSRPSRCISFPPWAVCTRVCALDGPPRAVSADPCAVLASIYVNPLQFGAGEDFEQYPRDLDADCLVAAQAGVDALWCPTDAQIYPEGPEQVFRLQVPQSLQQHLCGASRPGHFDGVATVVTRLLSLVRPSVLVLGEKDWQQLTILRHLVKGLGLSVRVMGCPTVRELDGLANSSRNRYLTPDQRHQAAMLPRLLQQEATAVQQIPSAEYGSFDDCPDFSGFEVDYVEVVNPSTLQPAAADQTCRLLAVAARCGSTRLIDHTVLMTRSPIVAIDGPAGAGKSTVTRAFAERMGLLYLDTGAMYRAVTWWVLDQGLDPADAAAVAPTLQGLEVELDPLRDGVQAVRVNGNDVTDEIRDPRVTAKVSVVAAYACASSAAAQQQRMGERGGLVAEGRDIGTAVFPMLNSRCSSPPRPLSVLAAGLSISSVVALRFRP